MFMMCAIGGCLTGTNAASSIKGEKTFITPDTMKGTPKYNFFSMLYCVHRTFNMPKEGETLWKTAEFLAKTYKAIPLHATPPRPPR